MNRRASQRPAPTGGGPTQERSTPSFLLLTPTEAAARLKVSLSWLAKARMRGDGPPYINSWKGLRTGSLLA
jgi:hypothetical protein